MAIPGRNDPCHCGSGKKYKKCHLQQDVESQGRKALDFTYESHLAMRRAVTGKLDRIIADNTTKRDIEAYRDEYWEVPFLDDEELDRLCDDDESETALGHQMIASLANALDLKGLSPAGFALRHQADRFSEA